MDNNYWFHKMIADLDELEESSLDEVMGDLEEMLINTIRRKQTLYLNALYQAAESYSDGVPGHEIEEAVWFRQSLMNENVRNLLDDIKDSL